MKVYNLKPGTLVKNGICSTGYSYPGRGNTINTGFGVLLFVIGIIPHPELKYYLIITFWENAKIHTRIWNQFAPLSTCSLMIISQI